MSEAPLIIFSMIDREELKRLFREANQRAEARQYSQAISVYRKVLTMAGTHDAVVAECAHWGISEVFFTLGDYPQALQSVESALSLNPCEAAYYYLKGVIYTRIGAEPEALMALGKALQLEPEKHKVVREYGWALHRFGYCKEGLEMLHKALSMKPHDHRTLTDLGWAYAVEGSYGASMVCLEHALELAPHDLGIAVALSTVDRYAGVPQARSPIPATGPNLTAPDEDWDDEEEEDWEDEETKGDELDDEAWEDEDQEDEIWEEKDEGVGEDDRDDDSQIDIH